jgi:hypothetical protein
MFRHIILLETGTLINLLPDAIATPAATDYILSKQYNLEVMCDGKKSHEINFPSSQVFPYR